ncbi:unnamed protein product, partial [Hapterophycus canaliculatus]
APGSTLTSLLPMGEPSPLLGAGLAARGGRLSGQGKKRPAGELAADTLAESKRLKRLEKNRESARECRRRKKENKERIEAHLASLEEENLNLRLQLKVGDEAEDAENCEILEIKKSLHDLVSRGVDEEQILRTMDLLTERFADYGSAHTSAADFHLAQLSRLLLPTLTTRVCMHAVLQAGGGGGGGGGRADARIEQGAAATGLSSAAADGRPEPGHTDGASAAAGGNVAYDSAVPLSERAAGAPSGNFSRLPSVQGAGGTGEEQKSGGEGVGVGVEDATAVDMWSSLVAVLEATGEQQAVMRNQVGAIAELARDLEGTTQIMERLRLLLADRNQTLDEEMAAIQ